MVRSAAGVAGAAGAAVDEASDFPAGGASAGRLEHASEIVRRENVRDETIPIFVRLIVCSPRFSWAGYASTPPSADPSRNRRSAGCYGRNNVVGRRGHTPAPPSLVLGGGRGTSRRIPAVYSAGRRPCGQRR